MSSSLSTLHFARTARLLAQAARESGLTAPSFRSPPRLVGVDRSIRRRGNGAVVAVAVRDRPWPAVLSDMIEGVVAVNRLDPPEADRLRNVLWAAVDAAGPSVVADVA